MLGRVTTEELLIALDIVESVRNTSSTTEKINILEQHKDNETLKTILELTYNPHKKFKVTNKTINLENIGDITECERFITLEGLTQVLSQSNINDRLRVLTNRFLSECDTQLVDMYKGILLKDLKLGVNTTTINKVWKGLIPTSQTGMEIKPMLASKIDFNKPPTNTFAITEKLDGIRCMAICKQDGIQLFTRQGKLIEGCLEVEQELQKLRKYFANKLGTHTEFVFDGELLAKNCSYKTVYKETTRRVKNKNKVKTGIEFKIFDMLFYDEFEEKKCSRPYSERIDLLTVAYISEMYSYNSVKTLTVLYVGENINKVLTLLEEYRLRGAEGLMLNLYDAPYEFKRSKNILKIKVMQTVDLRIVGFEEGQGRNEGKLGAILVDFNGNTVGVGSGFSDFDREYIWKNKEQYINKICEIQYFEVTKDKNGTESLRFPVWKHLRLDKVEPSLF